MEKGDLRAVAQIGEGRNGSALRPGVCRSVEPGDQAAAGNQILQPLTAAVECNVEQQVMAGSTVFEQKKRLVRTAGEREDLGIRGHGLGKDLLDVGAHLQQFHGVSRNDLTLGPEQLFRKRRELGIPAACALNERMSDFLLPLLDLSPEMAVADAELSGCAGDRAFGFYG